MFGVRRGGGAVEDWGGGGGFENGGRRGGWRNEVAAREDVCDGFLEVKGVEVEAAGGSGD